MKSKGYEYTTYPRRFEGYKWYKPLIVGVLTAVLTLVAQLGLVLIGMLWGKFGMKGALDAMDRSSAAFFSGPGALMAIGGVAAMMGALALSARIVKDRPFSSYSSSRGGWNWGIFGRSMILAALIFGVLILTPTLLFPEEGADHVNRFTLIGFLLCTILVPLQAAAEEYVFRGLIMQTVGSWVKIPVIAIAVSSLLFAVSHSYGVYGIIAVLSHGLMYAVVTCYTKGLEAGSAAHIANNLLVFYLTGFGLQGTAESGLNSLIAVIIMSVLYVAAIIQLDRKYGWFSLSDPS